MIDLSKYLNAQGELDPKLIDRVTLIPPGNYNVKLTDVTVTEPTEGRTEQLATTWEVVGGDYDGRTIRHWYGLDVKPIEGSERVNARGLQDIIIGMEAIEAKIPMLPITKPQQMRKLFAATFGKKTLAVTVAERAGTGQYAGKTYRNLRINGIARGNVQPQLHPTTGDNAGADESSSGNGGDDLA